MVYLGATNEEREDAGSLATLGMTSKKSKDKGERIGSTELLG